MNYIIVNKIFISGRDLFHDLARSRNSYFFLSLDEILQTAMRAELQNQKIVFVDGAIKKGVDKKNALEIFETIFSEYKVTC